MALNKNEMTIHSACEIDLTLLINFYKKAFPSRIDYLESNWRWLNRSDYFNNKVPIVLLYKNQVIAHAGMIPFRISMYDDTPTASWFIDFKILPEIERQGLGSILHNEWATIADCCLAIGCNIKSFGIFKKLGWIESLDTYMHLNFMLPFNHPRFVGRIPTYLSKILNCISFPFLFLNYSRHSYSKNSYQLEKLNKNSFDVFYNLYTKIKRNSENTLSPIRDTDYAKWRVLNSPNIDKYFIYNINQFSALVSLQNNLGKYIDILWVSDINDKIEIKRMISTLGVYGMTKGFSYMRFYTTKKELSDYLHNKTKSIVRHPKFVYFSKINFVFERLKTAIWDFELIDNDFEHM